MFSKLKSALLFTVLLCVFAYMGMSCGAPPAPKMQALADSLATQELVPYKGKNGKWGLSTLSHQVVLPCEYDDITIEEEIPLAIFIKQGEYWYVFDRKGNPIITEGYKYMSFRDNYWHLTKKEKGTTTLRDASGKRTIIEGYHGYRIDNNLILAYTDKMIETHIFDTTGKRLSNEAYAIVFKLNAESSYSLVSLDKDKYAVFSLEKGRISDYIFSINASGASDYIAVDKNDTAKIYKSYSGKNFEDFSGFDAEKDYLIYDSLLLPINTYFDTPSDSIIIDSAISYTGNKQIFSYKSAQKDITLGISTIAFSIDNGKTYRFIRSYDINRIPVPKYTVTAEELATIYSPIDIQKGQYIVLKDGKFGVWSAKTKQMLVAAEYNKVFYIRAEFYTSLDKQLKYPYQNNLILTNDKGGILFNPKSETTQNISGFDAPSNNTYIKNIFTDYLYIYDSKSKYYAIYSIKAGKIIGKLSSAFQDMVNENQKIFYLDSINGGMPLMQIKPNNELVQLAIIPNIKDNSINHAWDNGIVGKSYFSGDEMIWYDFAGKKIQAMDNENTYVYNWGIVYDKQTIYNTKLEKINYSPQGKIYTAGSVLVDFYGKKDENGNKSERLYLDWSGKPYAEQ
jgi:hypothetical protein